MKLEKIPPTIGLNIAKINKSYGEFLFWDVGGQKSLRKIWQKYFAECDGVCFIVDGSDESRFEEVRGVIDELYTRKKSNQNQPKIEKLGPRNRSSQSSNDFDKDLEGGGGGEEDDLSVEEILKRLPCLFLLNKNDKKEFKGVD